MPESTSNTQKIKGMLKKHRIALSEWTKAIEEQNDSTIRHAWRTTIKELLPPGSGRTVGISYQRVLITLKKKKVKGLKKEHRKILLEIAGILQSLKIGKFKFGEELDMGSRICDHQEGVIFIAILFATMTKTLDGFYVVLKDDMGFDKEESYEPKPITRRQAAELLKEKEIWGILGASSFQKVFKIRLLAKKPPFDEYFIGHDSDDGMFNIDHSDYSYKLNKILKIQGLLNISGKGILVTPLKWTREEIEKHIPWKIPEENWMLTFPTDE